MMSAVATRDAPAPAAGKRTAAPAPGRSAAVAVASAPQVASGAWIRFGTTPLSGAGKFMFTFSLVEILWGAIVLAVGITVALTQGHPFPVAQFAIAWGVTALLVSLFGGQALSRPAYRRGNLGAWKRRMRLDRLGRNDNARAVRGRAAGDGQPDTPAGAGDEEGPAA